MQKVLCLTDFRGDRTNNVAPPSPFGKIELYSAKYYAACTLGGIVACGLTHAAVTPLDLVPLSLLG